MNHRIVYARGTRIHVVEEASGPLVLLVHGFPESWYSWRHQLPAIAGAGFWRHRHRPSIPYMSYQTVVSLFPPVCPRGGTPAVRPQQRVGWLYSQPELRDGIDQAANTAARHTGHLILPAGYRSVPTGAPRWATPGDHQATNRERRPPRTACTPPRTAANPTL